MATVVFSLISFAFVAAQGGTIFLTAWIIKRQFKLINAWKPVLMLASYLFWTLGTVVAYTALGGGGGLFEGFGLLLTLFFTALISAFVYAVIWTVLPILTNKREVD